MAYEKLSEKGIYTLSLMSEDEKYFFVEVRALKSGVNRNNWDFTLEGIHANGETFVGQPLLIAYKGGKIGDGHNFDLTLNPQTGELEADFRAGDAERIVGEITGARVENQAAEDWLILDARIWKYYAQQLVDYIITKQAMDVSVEVEVDEGFEVRDDGVEVFDKWTGLGVTILGEGVIPAVEGARLRALTASDEYKQMKVLAASYVPKVNTSSNKGGKTAMNEALKKMLSAAMTEHGTILGYSADCKYASVLRTNGMPALYPLADFNESDGVIPSKFINASVMLSADIVGDEGEVVNILCSAEDINAQANAVAESAKAEAEQAKEECEQAKQECAAAQERIAELENAEKERTLKAMKDAFDNAVNAHNLTASAAEKITDEEVNAIHNSIAEGKFADTDSVVGEFKKLAYDKHVANTKKDKKVLAWEMNNGNGEIPTGEEAVIASFIHAGQN